MRKSNLTKKAWVIFSFWFNVAVGGVLTEFILHRTTSIESLGSAALAACLPCFFRYFNPSDPFPEPKEKQNDWGSWRKSNPLLLNSLPIPSSSYRWSALCRFQPLSQGNPWHRKMLNRKTPKRLLRVQPWQASWTPSRPHRVQPSKRGRSQMAWNWLSRSI